MTVFTNTAWAMREEALLPLLADMTSPSALQSARPRRAESGERLGIRDGVGILHVTGPLFKRSSWITEIFGATTYETLRRDLQAALDDDKIQSIALYVDSHGGEANGCDELARAIFEARSKKPVGAYISGAGCSAAYWLASAADRVVVSPAAMLGSIGVVLPISDRSKADERNGISRIEFVSSQSPGKGYVPARIQKMVDDLAGVFVKAVAKYRGVSSDTVIKTFGAGGVEIGANAVKKRMADAVGNFEGLLADLRKRPVPMRIRPLSIAGDPTPAVASFAPVTAPIRLSAKEEAELDAKAKAAAAKTLRIQAIFNSAAGRASPSRAAHFAFETIIPAHEAIEAMQREKTAAGWKAAFDNVNEIRRLQ
jgi:ClpP class serine protease